MSVLAALCIKFLQLALLWPIKLCARYCITPSYFCFLLFFFFNLVNLASTEELKKSCSKHDTEQIFSSDKILQEVQILLVATSEPARLGALTYLKPSKGSNISNCVLFDNISCTIGTYGSCVTALVISNRSFQAANKMVFSSFPNLCAVFAVGEVHGIMRHVKMWDVLVPSNLYTVTFNHSGKLQRGNFPILTSQFFCEWFSQPPRWPEKSNSIV